MNDVMVKTFYKQREEFNQMTNARQKTLSFPKGVIEYQNITYSTQHEAHRFDIFRPEGKDNETLPVIINVHGGGMILGNKEFNRYFCAQISSMGFLVFSIEFRLVPEFQVYDQYADLSTAMDFIRELLPKYHGDPDRVYLAGDSGGAYLIVYTIAMQKCKALAEAAHVTPSTLNIRALGLISGMFYTTKFDKIGLFMPKYLYGQEYKKGAFAPYVNPEHPDIVTSLPPCYLITSDDDNLQHYTLNFEKALTKHQVPHELVNYPKKPNNRKLTHAFSVFYPFMDESIEVITSMLEFFRKH
ncbi:MAG: alpha/beta hydrolase [Lachnospiraceae bacterium]|nr:alpha/beta hydrolase [Lachnospiraceae bacterium]